MDVLIYGLYSIAFSQQVGDSTIYIYIWVCRTLPEGICKDQIRGSVQDEWTQAQKAQNNEFVESGSKNQAIMNWTMANMELDDNHAQIRSTNMNELLV